MLRAAISVCACLVSLTVGTAAPLTGAPGPSPSSPNKTSSGGPPVGVFVKLDIETAIQGILANPLPSPGPVNTHPTVPQLHALLRSLYVKLMADPAVSGIIVGEHWDHIEMSSPSYPYVPVDGYDWSYLDDVFAVADQDHMPVQLLITPGLDSPRALLTAIPSCNGLFAKQVKNHQKVEKVKANCGTVVFPSIPEQSHADSRTFPLPWDSTYNQAWQGFLRLLNARYQDNPEFASIAVAGPVGASTEMILPTSAGTHNNRVDGMWATLIQHSFPHNTSYQGSDEVFVDQWDQTIDFYEKVFRGITLVLTPDSGSDLPDFSHSVAQAPGNELYPSDCAASISDKKAGTALYDDLMSCEAKTEVLTYFLGATGTNGKATKVGGMTASSPTTLTVGDIGIPGVKLLTNLSPAPSPPIGAGAEFDFPVSGNKIDEEGCPLGNSCALTVEQAAYNVLKVFFDYTSEAKSFGGTLGGGHVDFLGVPYPDVVYAEGHPCAELQNLLDTASQDLTGRTVACPT